ncbi:MAG: hypothetical protein SH847_12270 [Roseiflexaceae bacterium]|nr:hypothetical protein [Roseiflexaceae bacterium]
MQRRIFRMTVFGILGMVMCLALLTAMATPPQIHSDVRARWSAAGYGSYRLSLRVEYRGTNCYQQLEVRAGQTPRALRNTCEVAWLDVLSVPELFDLANQIEEIPSVRCMPSMAHCICQRVFSARQIDYDEMLGYPVLVLSRSYVRPNWTSVDFWENLITTGSPPNCGGPSPRRLTIQVLALTEMKS